MGELTEVRITSLIRFLYVRLRKQVELYHKREDEYLRPRDSNRNRKVWHPWIRLDELYEYSLSYNIPMEDVEGFISTNNVLKKHQYGSYLVGWRCTWKQYLMIFHFMYGRLIRNREAYYRGLCAEKGISEADMIIYTRGFIPEIKCRIGVISYMKERLNYEKYGDGRLRRDRASLDKSQKDG